MTTLRTFQNEIHEIQNREVFKQRAQLNFDRDRDKDNLKETRKHTNSKGKGKEDVVQAQTESGREFGHKGLQLQEIEEQILVRRNQSLWP